MDLGREGANEGLTGVLGIAHQVDGAAVGERVEDEAEPYEQKGKSNYNRKRMPDDAELDSSKTLLELWDLIRICDNEAYPAWFVVDGEKFILKRYRVDVESNTKTLMSNPILKQ